MTSEKWSDIIGTEIGKLQFGWGFAVLLTCLLPPGAFMRTRTAIYRLFGLRLGRGTTMAGTPTIVGFGDLRRRLTIGKRCFVNWPVHFDLSDRITIGDAVSIGHHVLLITATHRIGDERCRAGNLITRPITIEDGAWVGAGAIILPGVTIGHGAIVAAGAVVTKDVGPNRMVGGSPAREIRSLDGTNGL